MSLRQRLENLTVSRKLLAALLAMLATVLLVANLAFISAAYWISLENTAPEALHSLGRLIATPALSQQALASPANAAALLDTLQHHMEAVAYHHNNVARYSEPELEFEA